MYDDGYKKTGHNGYEPVLRHKLEDGLHLVAGRLLQALAEEFYSEEKEAQAAYNLEKDHNGFHINTNVPSLRLVGKVVGRIVFHQT